jgi:hypothetical protein
MTFEFQNIIDAGYQIPDTGQSTKRGALSTLSTKN